MARFEREQILETLARHGNRLWATARALRMDRHTLERKMRAHELPVPAHRSPGRPRKVAALVETVPQSGTGPRCTFHRWARSGKGTWLCTLCPAVME
jgi:Bacterial regulatory protein, Fis family